MRTRQTRTKNTQHIQPISHSSIPSAELVIAQHVSVRHDNRNGAVKTRRVRTIATNQRNPSQKSDFPPIAQSVSQSVHHSLSAYSASYSSSSSWL